MSVHQRLIATLLVLAAWSTACSSPSATQEYTPALPATTIAAPIATLDPTINMTGLVVAPDGAVWFSLGNSDFYNPTAGGVSRYAQGHLTSFTTNDGLPNANVQALAIAPDGSVWMAGAGCTIARYDGLAWQTVNGDCESIGGNVVDFAFTPDGSVWVATGMDVARFDGRSWTRYGKYAGWLAVAPDGTLWAKSWEWEDADLSEYVTRFDGENWTIVERLPIGRLFIGPDDSVWANLTGGYSEPTRLVRFNAQTWEILPGPSFTVLLEFAVAPNGELWAMTDQGFSRYDGATWLYAGVRPQGMTRFAFAADGSIWLGGSGGQLAHYQPATARLDFIVTPIPTITPDPTLLTPPPGPAPSPSVTPIRQLPVTNLVITPDGAVWYSFGNFDFHPRGGGIIRDYQGQRTRFTADNGLPGNSVQLLKVAPDGSLWAGIGCDLARFDGQAWQSILDNCDTLRGNVIDVAFTSDGATWVATGFNLARYREGTWTIYDRLANYLAVTPDANRHAHARSFAAYSASAAHARHYGRLAQTNDWVSPAGIDFGSLQE